MRVRPGSSLSGLTWIASVLRPPHWFCVCSEAQRFALAGLTYAGASTIITCLAFPSILSLALGYAFASLAFVAAAFRLVGGELHETLRREEIILRRDLRTVTAFRQSWKPSEA
jgi:hypothetical protein